MTEPKSESSAIETVDEQSQNSDGATKIEVLLKPVADAPILKQKKWAVDGNKSMAYVAACVKKQLRNRLDPGDSLFLYVNQCFAPSLDQTVSNLFDCFASDNRLILHYSKTQAWG